MKRKHNNNITCNVMGHTIGRHQNMRNYPRIKGLTKLSKINHNVAIQTSPENRYWMGSNTFQSIFSQNQIFDIHFARFLNSEEGPAGSAHRESHLKNSQSKQIEFQLMITGLQKIDNVVVGQTTASKLILTQPEL